MLLKFFRYFCVIGIWLTVSCVSKNTDDIPLIDTHIHLYDTNRPGGVPWPPKSDKVLYKPTLTEHYSPIIKQNGIAATVVVEASDIFEDNLWLLKITESEKEHYSGIVGNLAAGSPDFRKQLKELCKYDRFVGVRMRSNKNFPYFTDVFWQNIKALESSGKTLDILARSVSLEEVYEIGKRYPNLKIMINHLAFVPMNDDKAFEEWKAPIIKCASLPNIYCKFSGFFGRSQKMPAPLNPQFYQERVDYLVKVFGEDRLVYGSNWPVTDKFGSYEDYKKLVLGICQKYGKTFTKKVLYRNAIKFYGLPDLN